MMTSSILMPLLMQAIESNKPSSIADPFLGKNACNARRIGSSVWNFFIELAAAVTKISPDIGHT